MEKNKVGIKARGRACQHYDKTRVYYQLVNI